MRVFQVMETADWHIYQVLTKRSSLMRDFVNEQVSGNQRPLAYLAGRVGRSACLPDTSAAFAGDGGCRAVYFMS